MRLLLNAFLYILLTFVALVAIGVLVVLPLGLMGWGAWAAWRQGGEIAAVRPVGAQILGSEIRTRDEVGPRGPVVRHLIAVRYRYAVDGHTYEGTRATSDGIDELPYFESAGIVRDYPRGSTRTAYYFAGDPARSYLISRHSATPYAAYFAGLAVLIVTICAVTWAAGYPRVTDPARLAEIPPDRDGLVPLAVAKPLGARARVNALRAALIAVPAWAGGWHVLAYYPAGPPALAWGVPGAFTAVALLFANVARRARAAGRTVADPRVRVAPATLRIGQTARVRVEHDLLTPGPSVGPIRVGLVCTRTTGSGRTTNVAKVFEVWHEDAAPPVRQPAAGDSLARRAQSLAGGAPAAPVGIVGTDAALVIPPTCLPTGPGNPGRIAWKLVLITTLPGPTYKAEFDVVVTAA